MHIFSDMYTSGHVFFHMEKTKKEQDKHKIQDSGYLLWNRVQQTDWTHR